MKLRISNLGVINTMEIDMSKPFILFAGDNGTGKTYAATFLYSLILDLRKMLLNKNFHFENTELLISKRLKNGIEGEIKAGQKVVVIEDLVSTGKSSLAAVDALREAGVEVVGMLSIFTYQMQIATDNFAAKQCELHTLTNYTTLIDEAIKENSISKSDLDSLMEWRKDQQAWSNKFNG